MKNEINADLENMTAATPEPEDYTGAVSYTHLDVYKRQIPDSTLEFLPIFSSSKYAKSSIFSGFLHSLQWFDPQKLPRCFQA